MHEAKPIGTPMASSTSMSAFDCENFSHTQTKILTLAGGKASSSLFKIDNQLWSLYLKIYKYCSTSILRC